MAVFQTQPLFGALASLHLNSQLNLWIVTTETAIPTVVCGARSTLSKSGVEQNRPCPFTEPITESIVETQ